MKNRNILLSPFLGGFLGILITGYAFYVTGEEYPWLLPLGVIVGSAIGYLVTEVAWKKTFQQFSWPKLVRIPEGVSSVREYAILHNYWYVCYGLLLIPVVLTVSFYQMGLLAGDNPPSGFNLLVAWCILLYSLGVSMSLLVNILLNGTTREVRKISKQRKYRDQIVQLMEQRSRLRLYMIKNLWRSTYKSVVVAFPATALMTLLLLYAIAFGAAALIPAIALTLTVAYMDALHKHRKRVMFATTLLITVVMYFLTRMYFGNIYIVWLTAFATGSISAFVNLWLYERALPIKKYIVNHFSSERVDTWFMAPIKKLGLSK